MHKSILSTSLVHCLPDYAVQAGVFWVAAFMIIWKSATQRTQRTTKNAEKLGKRGSLKFNYKILLQNNCT